MSLYQMTPPPIDCPSWAQIAQQVDEGGTDFMAHASACETCRERYQLVHDLFVTGAGDTGGLRQVATCPSVGDWVVLSAAVGEMPHRIETPRRIEMVEHLASCEACAQLWRYLVAADDSSAPDWEVRDAGAECDQFGQPSQSRPHQSLFASVAAVVFGIGLLIALFSGLLPKVGVGGDARWRGPSPDIRASVAWDLGDRYPTVSWGGSSEATSYRIRVWDRQGVELLVRALAPDARSFELTLAGVSPGSVVIWQVEALAAAEVIAQGSPESLVWLAR